MNNFSFVGKSGPTCVDSYSSGRYPITSDSLSNFPRDARSPSPLSTSDRKESNNSPFANKFGSTNVSSRDLGYSAEPIVVQPYEIEEPDDYNDGDNDNDPCDQAGGPMNSNSSISVGRWQEDLVNYMQDLGCHSETNGSQMRAGQSKGKKRRSSNYSLSRRSSWTASSLGNSRSESNPRRLRKRRRKSKAEFLSSRSAFSSQIPDGGPSSKISNSRSSGNGGMETTNRAAGVDDMDVD